MKTITITCVLLLLLGACDQQRSQDRKPKKSVTDGEKQALRRLAIDAAIWGTPVVGTHAMRQAFLRDAGAKYGDIVYWSDPADWKTQIATINATVRYVYFHFNSRNGPLVLEIPQASGAGLFGSIVDAWQAPMADLGPEGEDRGKGAKYLIIPPDYHGQVPAGYLPVRFSTYNGAGLLRVIPNGTNDAAALRALKLIKQIRLYPLSQAKSPPAMNHIDMSGKLFDGTIRFDTNFYAALATMLNEEPELRDTAVHKKLNVLGIYHGLQFSPDSITKIAMTDAISEVHMYFIRRASEEGSLIYLDKHWRLPSVVGSQTEFTFKVGDTIDAGSRGVAFFYSFAQPKSWGKHQPTSLPMPMPLICH